MDAENLPSDQTHTELPADPVTKGQPANERYKLGVLFVHGMGEQQEGETLSAFGEPVIAWIREWIDGHGQFAFSEPIRPAQREGLAALGYLRPDGVEVSRTALFPSKRLSTDPPHCVVDLRIKHEGVGRPQNKQSWLFAESWWGEQVQPPSVFILLRWLFSRGPFVAFAHAAEHAWQFTHPDYNDDGSNFHKFVRKLDVTRWRQLAWPTALLRFLLPTLLLQLGLLIAWVIALVPIPVVRKYVVIVLQQGTRILGDSYGLVANDIQRGAILTRFRHTVEWLENQCDKLLIVAHSQGAGVVHAAIQERVIAPPALLVTFGAGLVKLAQLRQCEVSRRTRLIASGWIVPTALAAVTLLLWDSWGAAEDVSGLKEMIWTFAIASFSCAVATWFAWHETHTQLDFPQDLRCDDTHRWIDLYASADPVPQGPMTAFFPGRGIVSERIINRRSTMSDHNAYWQNKTEFVSRLVAEMDHEAGGLLEIPNLKCNKDYKAAIKHHHRAALVLLAAWWLVLLSVFDLAASRFQELASVGERFIAALQGGPLDAMIKYIQAPGLLIRWLTVQLTGSIPDYYPQLGYASLVVAGVLLAAYLCWTALAALLTQWANALLSDFVGYSGAKTWGEYGAYLVWPFILLPPLGFALAIHQGLNPFVEIIRWCVVPIALIITFFFCLAIWQHIPKDANEVRRVFLYIRDKVLDAITPGSDDRSSARRGWEGWNGMFQVFMSALFISVGLAVSAEKLTGGDHAGLMIFASYAVIALILPARTFRLVIQRGRAISEAIVVTVAPLAVAAVCTSFLDLSAFQLTRWILWFVILSLLLAAIAYAAVDRLMRERASPATAKKEDG
jgi:hypothetical protein